MSQIQLGKLSLVLQPMDYKTLGRMSWCMVTFLGGEYDDIVLVKLLLLINKKYCKLRILYMDDGFLGLYVKWKGGRRYGVYRVPCIVYFSWMTREKYESR
jgi:hypothetical protein